MIFTSILIISIISFISWYQIKYRRRNYLLSQIPSPKKLPLLHNSLEFIGSSAKHAWDWMEEKANTIGPVYQVTLTPFDPGFAVVNDAKIAEAILTSQKILTKTIDYDFLKEWIGIGLLISSDKKWFQRRKLLTPGFHFQILEKFAEIMDEHANVFVNELMKFDEQQVDIFPKVNLFALDTVCECTMGVNISCQTKDSDYVRAVKEITKIIMVRTFDITKQIDFIYQFTDMYKREKKCIEILHSFSDEIIESRRRELLTENNNDDIKDDVGGKRKKKALLDILLSSTIEGEPLNNSDIREEVDTFMFAGHDTTTSAISFLFYVIAKYPEVQQKIYDEVIEVLGNDDGDVTIQKLSDLHYLDLVIKESLRLFPPVAYYGRKLSEELVTEKYTFPKDLNIYVSPYLMGRNEKYFPNPEKFDPHRFDAETTYEKMNPFTYVPFSAGPRNCIGQKFAQTEMRIIASKVVRNFELSVPKSHENLSLTSEVIMRSENGIVLNIKMRK